MGNIQIILDSTAHVSSAMLKQHDNLHVVPLKVMLGQQQWLEDAIDNTELFHLKAATGFYPKTSQPAPGEFAAAFAPLAARGDDIIVITLAGALSGTVQSARMGVQLAGKNNIHVVDSGTTAAGMVHMAEFALQQAAAGIPAGSIVAYLERMAGATHTLFIPDTLEYLHKGGRIGGAAALVGTILQIKPILYLVKGRVAVLDKVRTRPKAVQRMVEEVKQYRNLAYIAIVHIERASEAEGLATQMENLFPGVPLSLGNIGAVLGAHLGPGIIGIVFQEVI
ncbi:degv [Lucifera butyrica]|uniref:Degv n=1 Tax=Lucifera butyrica TaxID=1351585 RepID=A0A498R4A7_9FIRM|nr:DegV family protein [Lucifera butyrica]VBB05965.1 degv [Lucifera butyrica]